MEETQRFPLLFWQETDQFKSLYETEVGRLREATKKWAAAGGSWTYSGSIRCTENGTFDFWLNSNASHRMREPLKVETAILYSKKHGVTGWWTVQDLENLLLGEGDLFERAMWDNGFRRHKKKPEEWARRNKTDEWTNHRRVDHVYRPVALESDEGKRLESLITIPNAAFKYSTTMSFVVGTNGMIHGELNMNPMGGTTTESMPAWMADYNVRGHINNEQRGFTIEARNIQLGDEKYIHVITTGGTGVSECLWPTIIQREHVKNIAHYLVTGEEIALVA